MTAARSRTPARTRPTAAANAGCAACPARPPGRLRPGRAAQPAFAAAVGRVRAGVRDLAAVIYHRHCLWPQVRETMERFASNEHRGEKQEDVARPLHARLLPWKGRTLPTARSRRNKRALHNSRRRIGRRCAFRGPIGRRPTGRPVLFRGPLGRFRAGRSYAHPAMDSVRRPAVAGTFYPDDPDELSAVVSRLLESAPPRQPAKAIVAPHAGYVYSGPIAASAFQCLPSGVRRVVLLGPSHFALLRGV